jgi:hypothetical protein
MYISEGYYIYVVKYAVNQMKSLKQKLWIAAKFHISYAIWKYSLQWFHFQEI